MSRFVFLFHVCVCLDRLDPLLFLCFFIDAGGGFAISDASKVSGLSVLLGDKLSGLKALPPFALMLVSRSVHFANWWVVTYSESRHPWWVVTPTVGRDPNSGS